MSTAKDVGGPAFPLSPASVFTGMTVRDYMAAHADVSKVEPRAVEAAEEIVGRPIPEGTLDQLIWQADLIAKVRYLMADAMIKARNE